MIKFDSSWTKQQTVAHYGEKVVNAVCSALCNLGIDYPIFVADRVNGKLIYQIEHPNSLCMFLEFAKHYESNKINFESNNR